MRKFLLVYSRRAGFTDAQIAENLQRMPDDSPDKTHLIAQFIESLAVDDKERYKQLLS